MRSESGKTKCYICLFSCALTRAVLLEVVSDFTERSFLQSFRRFTSRKSLPYHMLSDNVSTYLSAADELEKLFQSPSLSSADRRWMAVYPQKSAMVWAILGVSYRTIQTGDQENTRKSLYHLRSHPERQSHYLCIRRCRWWRGMDTFTSSIWAKNHPTTIPWNWRWSNRSNLWWWFWPETKS